jgi:SAM-dependent methyltransferase
MKMYGELAEWWPLLSHPNDYLEEASFYEKTIEAHATIPVNEVLELGSGGGNNASHMKRRFTMTLADLSEGMLAVSRKLNPECEHIQGDMRTLRLDRPFDAVLIHDAIMYMTTEEDLAAAITTAAVHLRPGGVALFASDDTVESYRATTQSGGEDGDGRSARWLQWNHRLPDGETSTVVSYAIVLRENGKPTRVVLDEHDFGLFPRATWLRLIEGAGLKARALPYDISDFAPDNPHEMFVGFNAVADR